MDSDRSLHDRPTNFKRLRCLARNWFKRTVDSLLDISTLKRDGDRAQMMSMLDFIKPGIDPKTKEPIRSIIGLNEYLCEKAQYRPIEYKVFSGNKGEGKVVADVKSPDSPFEAITSGSWAAGVYSIACRAK